MRSSRWRIRETAIWKAQPRQLVESGCSAKQLAGPKHN
jgi:hypothetical protein